MANFTVGLDFGQAQDFTAVATVERRPAPGPGGGSKHALYQLRHLQRFPLGTPYTAIVPAVVQLLKKQPLRGSPLLVDATGVGRALVDMLRREGAGSVIPITITGGQGVTETDDGDCRVPKKD